jgi:predicted kinase
MGTKPEEVSPRTASSHYAIICDLDGTLCNCEHRRHHVRKDPPDWKSFFEAMDKDTLNEPLRKFLWSMHTEVVTLFVSGRPDNYRSITERWLIENLSYSSNFWETISEDNLFMRKSGDFRPDWVVKEEILKEEILPNYEVLCVIDDRPSVVDMWRRNNLLTFALPYDGEPKCDFDEGDISLVLMVGPSGAGKSHWLKNNIEERDDNRNWLTQEYGVSSWKQFLTSSDDIRFRLTGCYNDLTKQDKVFGLIHDQISMNCKYGITTVVDATNIKNKYRKDMVKLVPENTKVLYLVVNRPLEAKVKDYQVWADLIDHTNEEVIRKMDQTFKSNLKDILAGDNLPNVEVVDLRKE